MTIAAVLRVAVLLLAAATAAWATPSARADEPIRVGSKRFTESYVLAWVLAKAAGPGTPVEVRAGLGNTAIVWEALRAGRIDVYPEYTGTIDRELLKGDGGADLAALNARLAPLGFAASVPLGFNNGYALAMREADAERLGIRRLSDLAAHPTLRIAPSNEFVGRADGWPSLVARYRLPQTPTGLDHALGYTALAEGRIDVKDVYTTDARIGRLGLRVLVDDLGVFPRYDAVLLHRADLPARSPAAWARLRALAGSIDEAAMIAMNARAELDGVAFETVADDFLRQRAGRSGVAATGTSAASAAAGAADAASSAGGASSGPAGFLARLLAPDLGPLVLRHLLLVVASTAAAAAIGIPLAVAVAARPAARALAIGAAGVMQTVPSLALLAALVAVTGTIGPLPATIALTLYALLPIVRDTVLGLTGVPAGLRDAADALALNRGQRLRHVELPVAMPSIVAGLRTATTIGTGTATIAAFIGAGGLGERIVTGLALNDGALLLAGAVPAAALALALDGVLGLLERRMRRAGGGP
ncbi:MAG: glycine betaine ABC transporter substrate-binding protein [Burkholderiales bacterium]